MDEKSRKDSPDGDEPDTEHLARRAQAGDTASFAALYERVAPALFAWSCLRLPEKLRSRLDPDDIVHEVVFRAYSGFGTFVPGKRPFRAWVFGIANNVIKEYLRRLRGNSGSMNRASSSSLLEQIPDEATAVSQRVARIEGLQAFVDRTKSLADAERKLLVFRGLEGLEHREVAKLLDISEDAAQKRWQRLLVELNDGTLPSELLRE